MVYFWILAIFSGPKGLFLILYWGVEGRLPWSSEEE